MDFVRKLLLLTKIHILVFFSQKNLVLAGAWIIRQIHCLGSVVFRKNVIPFANFRSDKLKNPKHICAFCNEEKDLNASSCLFQLMPSKFCKWLTHNDKN